MEYQLLGVGPGASKEEVKAAYKREALKWHPDKHCQASPAEAQRAADRFKQISEAYERISKGHVRRGHGSAAGYSGAGGYQQPGSQYDYYSYDTRHSRGSGKGGGSYTYAGRTYAYEGGMGMGMGSRSAAAMGGCHSPHATSNLMMLWGAVAFGAFVCYFMPDSKPPKRAYSRPGNAAMQQQYLANVERRAPMSDPQDNGLYKTNKPPQPRCAAVAAAAAGGPEVDGQRAANLWPTEEGLDRALHTAGVATRATGSSLHGPELMYAPPARHRLAADAVDEDGEVEHLDSIWRKHQTSRLKGKGINRRTRPFDRNKRRPGPAGGELAPPPEPQRDGAVWRVDAQPTRSHLEAGVALPANGADAAALPAVAAAPQL